MSTIKISEVLETPIDDLSRGKSRSLFKKYDRSFIDLFDVMIQGDNFSYQIPGGDKMRFRIDGIYEELDDIAVYSLKRQDVVFSLLDTVPRNLRVKVAITRYSEDDKTHAYKLQISVGGLDHDMIIWKNGSIYTDIEDDEVKKVVFTRPYIMLDTIRSEYPMEPKLEPILDQEGDRARAIIKRL